MKKKTPEQMLEEHCKDIRRELRNWHYINEHGCNDPFWPDGCNMNLTRNHVIYALRQIAELCEEHGWELPEEYYLPVPPKVPDNYMATLDQVERVKRIRQCSEGLTTVKTNYDDKQLQLNCWW